MECVGEVCAMSAQSELSELKNEMLRIAALLRAANSWEDILFIEQRMIALTRFTDEER